LQQQDAVDGATRASARFGQPSHRGTAARPRRLEEGRRAGAGCRRGGSPGRGCPHAGGRPRWAFSRPGPWV